MRKRLMWTLALGTALAVTVAAVAIAEAPTVIEAGNLVLKANGGVTPKALPKKTMVPITVHVSGDISTKDGTHPPALREVIIDFDKNGTVNAKGLPVCREGQITNRSTTAAKNACPKAIVGSGHTEVDVAFAEQNPFRAKGPLVLFNGGVKGKTTTMYIHAYVAVPTPTAIVVPVKITKVHAGRYGTHTVSTIPQVAGGAGSSIHFDLKVHRIFGVGGSYVSAKCPDGHFNAHIVKAVFRKEAGATTGPASTELSGTVVRRCTPRG